MKTTLFLVLVRIKNILRQFPFIIPRGIVHSTKDWINIQNQKLDWFKRKNSDWYETHFQEKIVYYPKPNSIYEDLNIYFKNQFVKKNMEANLYFFKGAYVFSNYGNILSRDSKVLSEFCHYFNTKSIISSQIYKPFKAFKLNIKKISENTVVLAAPESENYYHWIMDCLPRLYLVEAYINAIDYFVLPENIQSFHIDSLKYWGVEEKKIIKMNSTDKLFFENLFVPSLPGSEGNSPKWAINYLRKKFLINEENYQKQDLVFFSRKNVKQRRILNENEVIDNLKRRGFLIYEMSSYGLKEQITIIRKAKIIVSPHGAALTNLVFADKCKILEIFSPDYIRPDCFFTLASQLELEYWYLFGKSPHKDEKNSWGNMVININELNLILDRMLNVK